MALSSTIRTLRSRDISDSIPFNVGQPGYVSDVWTNTTVAYDVAIGGLPFFYGINNDRPYERQTAPYKKQQFDNSKEPGEQTLEGWWIRSQSSFHRGAGINFTQVLNTSSSGEVSGGTIGTTNSGSGGASAGVVGIVIVRYPA